MIQIFITGGTFDKSYNYKNGELFFEKTHLPEMLKRSRCRLKISIETLMMIDSLEMNSSHIKNIISKCQDSNLNKIVITHGTDRMVSTAKALSKAKIHNKTIVLTGAMIPYEFGSSSDGFFNLGCALSYVQTLKSGVYITMQGQYFKSNEIIKNSKEGLFEKL
ncbi:MAG: asparaginase [Flavobacteriaceae bacterium]|nr:asparaginase [Flavobacteriaceae bacterium]|tara:strand:+ start:688 stop:1176 length:489 start_codon:yes stop_codon:yes gene_type:complete